MMTKDDALKMAIETNNWLKSHLWVDSLAGEELDKVPNACKEALEQPSQEPVAWIKDWADGSKELVPNKYDSSYPVYTHPHQWQGLTDDEIQAIRIKTFDAIATNYEVYRSIEQALKGKNHD